MKGVPSLSRSSRAVAVAILVAAIPTAAAAQFEPEVQTGSRIPVEPQAVEAARAGVIGKAFSRCIYRANPSAARKLLMHSDPASIDLEAAGLDDLSAQFSMDTCLSKQVEHDQSALGMRFPTSALRAMLAEEAYLAANPHAPVLAEGATEATDRTFVSDEDDLVEARTLAAFDDCIIFRDAAKADALLRTMPGSDAERSAAVALAPTLGSCLPQGQTIALTPKSIRTFVADGLWTRFVRPIPQHSAKPAQGLIGSSRPEPEGSIVEKQSKTLEAAE